MIDLAAIVLSALAWFFSTGAHDVWLLAWVAPAPVLALAYRTAAPFGPAQGARSGVEARRAAIAAFVAAGLGSLTWVQLYAGLLPALVLARIVLSAALLFTLVVMGARWIAGRQPAHVALFAFPLLAAGADYLLALVSPDGSAGSLAYTQVDVRPVLQVVSVTGLWGITFLLALVASGLALAWRYRARRRELALTLARPLVIVAICVSLGWMRASHAPLTPTVRIGLAAISQHDSTGADAVTVAREYAQQVDALAAAGAHLVLLPEKAVRVTAAARAAVRQVFADAAKRNHIALIAGVDETGAAPRRNVALVFDRAGGLAIATLKQHLPEGGERGYVPGRTIAVWTDSAWMYGVAIGTVLEFPSLGRAYGRKDVGVLFVPASDSVRDARLSVRMAIARAVENGYSLVRSAHQGLLIAADPYGRVIAERRGGASAAVQLTADVPVRHVRTAYVAIDDWFAWACLIVAAGMALDGLRPGGK
jgi:apolipoprotein N-acyltransferase